MGKREKALRREALRLLERERGKQGPFHRFCEGFVFHRKSQTAHREKCQFLELMLLVMSRMVAAMSGLVFMASSTFRMAASTVA